MDVSDLWRVHQHSPEGVASPSMRRLSVLLLLPLVFLVPSTKFRNCDALRKKFPNGVALNVKSVGTSGARVNATVYKANKGLDRDKDGVACES